LVGLVSATKEMGTYKYLGEVSAGVVAILDHNLFKHLAVAAS